MVPEVTTVYKVVFPTVLVMTLDPEVIVVKTGSVVIGLDVGGTVDELVESDAAVYRVVLPTVLVITLEPEVMVVSTGSVVYGVELLEAVSDVPVVDAGRVVDPDPEVAATRHTPSQSSLFFLFSFVEHSLLV